ncbi:ergothioneine biosynthesis glutamate--cysteine ligase EgtA [Pseudonocardia sp. 73-21]|uniref:ergothioneine biosynthesis glutamate--cysteine ligase EgtA n=1 Tax=Pseudonocardia sp. 73-21 TaxID=1895809 RepID=UPI000967AF55|nr:ergothioneine biosynthesis glutamate--cysteine ligase EgtA [Pseudonocardia sp. 73-21]OJY39147.1 MAG: ergothioneine biosynthesis glutamate--cysteine ligase EgtA [Pseudonocardia sp. 73-21]
MTQKPGVAVVAQAVTAAEDAAPDAGPSVLHDCADAEAYVASVCFKHGPPTLVGVELEWLLHDVARPGRPVTLASLAAALGPHTPRSLDPASPARPLPAGSEITVEPGGQIEIASPPLPGLPDLVGATVSDAEVLHGLLAAHGLHPESRAADASRPPVRLLDLPRYRAMEQAFDRIGTCGRTAMCSTSAVQVCVDAGQGAEVARRWSAVHALGPVLLAAFANSPTLNGRDTGWKSARWMSWLQADEARTGPPPVADVDALDPAAAWARRVMESPVLCVRRDDGWLVPEAVTFADWVCGGLPGPPPTTADLDYHVSTLFPPVRPHGHLEVRYIDMQPGRGWALPTAVLTALLADGAVLDRAREACEPARERWVSAARRGLEDPVLATAAAAVFELAVAQLPAVGAPGWLVEDLTTMTEHRVLRGLCPADLPEGES